MRRIRKHKLAVFECLQNASRLAMGQQGWRGRGQEHLAERSCSCAEDASILHETMETQHFEGGHAAKKNVTTIHFDFSWRAVDAHVLPPQQQPP